MDAKKSPLDFNAAVPRFIEEVETVSVALVVVVDTESRELADVTL